MSSARSPCHPPHPLSSFRATSCSRWKIPLNLAPEVFGSCIKYKSMKSCNQTENITSVASYISCFASHEVAEWKKEFVHDNQDKFKSLPLTN